jgi:uroporphyrinogen decarboxylase
VDYPPIWLMRQAGRALPEYRALKETHTFLQLVQTPELAAEVTLQPIRRFGFDAAVLFSDILIVAEALGQHYRFREGGGIEMDFAVASAADIDRLRWPDVREKLAYVSAALGLIKQELAGRTALLGFAGTPWTLANFMMEGGSASEFTRARQLLYSDPALFARFMERMTGAVTETLQLQVDAGADAVQLFDSLAGSLPAALYEEASGRWIRQIVAALKPRVPVIVFARNLAVPWHSLANSGASALSVDWTVPLDRLRAELPGSVAIQGNLDPFVLTTTLEAVRREAARVLDALRGRPGHIFNLGHGLPPAAKLGNIEALVETVRHCP